MASQSQVSERLSLEEFLRMPGIDEAPYLEYIDGRVVSKVSPQMKHGSLTRYFLDQLNQFAEPPGSGEAFPEIRCTFAGRSIVPDVIFLLEEHIAIEEDGSPVDTVRIPPDIHIEIISPDQSPSVADEKLRFSTANGCPLGWRVDPYRETIDCYRPDQATVRLTDGDILEGAPVLTGFRLPVADVFRWLKRRKGRRGS